MVKDLGLTDVLSIGVCPNGDNLGAPNGDSKDSSRMEDNNVAETMQNAPIALSQASSDWVKFL